MSDVALATSVVRIVFSPYNHGEVQTLLHRVATDFGLPGAARRWWFDTASTADIQDNVWIIDFLFRDPHDAVMFGLRHQR